MTDPGRYERLRQQYERPGFPWRCGREGLWLSPCPAGPTPEGGCGGAADCRPRRRGERWECRRPASAGGPCAEGPLPDGLCAVRRPPCAPLRTLRWRRGRLVLFAAGATVALLVLFLSGCSRADSTDAGPLSAVHASFVRDPVDGRLDCAACHKAHGRGPTAWLKAALFPSRPSEGCLSCHGFGGPGLAAHNTSFPGRPDAPEADCAACHDEHRGAGFDLSAVPDRKCSACHRTAFESFSDGHPAFPADFPHGKGKPAFDHLKHMKVHFKQPGKAALAPRDCADCHDTAAAGRQVRPSGFERTCAACHGTQMSDPLVVLRVAGASSGAEAEPSAFQDWLAALSTGAPRAAVLKELEARGAAPLAERLKGRSGSADAMLSGAGDSLIQAGLSAWAKDEPYEPAFEEPRAGGWHWLGDLSVEPMELRYRPRGHADPVVRAWLEFATEAARSARGPEERKAARALRDKLTHASSGAGRCMKCHAPQDPERGWRFIGAEPRPFTRFAHPPHLKLEGWTSCASCHALSAKGGGFEPISLESCRSCHAEGKVRQDCRLCHGYHPAGALRTSIQR